MAEAKWNTVDVPRARKYHYTSREVTIKKGVF